MQRHQLLAGVLGDLVILEQFGHAKNAGQRIVEFVSEAPNHLPHRCQALALNDLLFQLLFGGYIAYGDDHAGRLALGIKHGTCCA